MENRQAPEEQRMGHMEDTARDGTAPMSFGWKFEPIPLEEAMGLARASRMDSAEYSMLREQFTLLVDDKIASVRITPPPAVSYQKARNHCLKVAKHLAVAITVRRAPGGQLVCWKATPQEIEMREKRVVFLKRRTEQQTQEKAPSSHRGKRKTARAS